jgi:hypothetical protein
MASKHRDGLQTRGKAFYENVTAELELEPHEQALLVEAARCLDRLEALHLAIEKIGFLTPDGRVQPAVTEVRLQGVTFSRLVASLRLPDDYAATFLDRGQRRGAARGTYVPKAKLLEMKKNA